MVMVVAVTCLLFKGHSVQDMCCAGDTNVIKGFVHLHVLLCVGVSIPQATETTHSPARASPAPAMSSVDRTCAAGATFVPADPSTTTSTQRTSTIELQSRKHISYKIIIILFMP